MGRILVITTLMAFATGASAKEPQCEDCKSTWTQWFGNTATFVWAYAGLSAHSPKMQEFNAMAATKGLALATSIVTFVASKIGRGVAVSPMEKID